MENAFSLRPATLDDLMKIVDIENRVHPSPWTKEHFQSELEKPYSLSLVFTDDETDSVIVGYIVAWVMFEECQILNIAVDLPHRGLGYAKEMIRKIIGVAQQKGAKKAVLDVRKSNSPAIHLYQGAHFHIAHVRKNFYSNGEDAYQMTLPFDGDIVF